MSVTFPEQVEKLVAQAEQIDLDAARRALDILEQYHQRIMTQLADRSDLGITDIQRVKAEVETLMREYQGALRTTVSGYQADAWDLADDVVNAQLSTTGIRTGIAGVSQQTLNVMQGYSADLIKGLTDDALRRINTELQLASLGGRTFPELMKNIGANLDSPSVFGTIANRSEMIARTEVSRAYSLGYRARGNEVAGRVPGTRKTWTHATGMVLRGKAPKGMYRPRPAHVALDGTTIPWEDMFSVGGYEVHGPHDPRLPASESVGCKCRLTLDFSQVYDETLRIT